MLGALFLPKPAEAGFFSYILGNRVSSVAEAEAHFEKNSQNMDLLQANVFSASAIPGKEEDESAAEDITIVSSNALLAVGGPVGTTYELDLEAYSSDQLSIYVVRDGDSLGQIAEMFDVSISTILSANDMKKGQKISPGQVLVILPISGVEHTVTKGQTLASIAKLYKVDVQDIKDYNGLASNSSLSVGDELIIPGGNMPEESGKPSSNLASSASRDQNYYASHPIQNLAGYFVNPVPTGRKTQGLHGPGHRGIDIGAPKGTPIYAAAAGTVMIAKTGWSGGYGNMAIIQHPNGTKTLYAHMSKLGTSTGAEVTQGQIIGYVGSTGKSTGPHLHFEVFNAKNPGSDYSWAH